MIAVPGQTPRFPLRTVEPVLVTVDPARAAKVPAVPRIVDSRHRFSSVSIWRGPHCRPARIGLADALG